MKKPLVIVGALILVLLLVKVGLSLGSKMDDQAEIQKTLHESIKASREGKSGGVMDKLSSQLKFNEEEAGGNMRQVADFIRNQRPDITFENETPIVTGDEARLTSPVELKVNFLGQSKSFHLKNVVIVFRKEDDRSFLVLPTKKWKLSEVRVPDINSADFFQ